MNVKQCRAETLLLYHQPPVLGLPSSHQMHSCLVCVPLPEARCCLMHSMATHSLTGSQLESSCTTEENMNGEGGSFPGLCKLACTNEDWYTKTVHMHIMGERLQFRPLWNQYNFGECLIVTDALQRKLSICC